MTIGSDLKDAAMNDARCRLFLVTPPAVETDVLAACFNQAA